MGIQAPGGSGGGGAASSGDAVIDIMGGRLTLESGVSVSATDQTAKGTLYYTPFNSDKIALYDGSNWSVSTFTERSIALSGGTASRPHDVFIYDNSGTLTLELVAWTDDTTRATALATQDGVYVKSGATGRRYIGTIYIDSSNQCEDSGEKRHVWNMDNRVDRELHRNDTGTTSWSLNSAGPRQANANTDNKVEVVSGVNDDCVSLALDGIFNSSSSSAIATVGIGLGDTTIVSDGGHGQNQTRGTVTAHYAAHPGLGRREFWWLEASQNATITYYGLDEDSTSGYRLLRSGMRGVWRC